MQKHFVYILRLPNKHVKPFIESMICSIKFYTFLQIVDYKHHMSGLAKLWHTDDIQKGPIFFKTLKVLRLIVGYLQMANDNHTSSRTYTLLSSNIGIYFVADMHSQIRKRRSSSCQRRESLLQTVGTRCSLNFEKWGKYDYRRVERKQYCSLLDISTSMDVSKTYLFKSH